MQGNISYIALLPGQYLDIAQERGQYPDIAWEGDFQLSFDPPFDPTFHLQVTAIETSILYST